MGTVKMPKATGSLAPRRRGGRVKSGSVDEDTAPAALRRDVQPSDEGSGSGSGSDHEPAPKRRRLPPRKKKEGADNRRPKELWARIFDPARPDPDFDEAMVMHQPGRSRPHALRHHAPLLLSGSRGLAGRRALLAWFDGVASTREMPWRKAWIDPRAYDGRPDALREALERRAYEVWISEIMLQQTRVAVVIGYWTRWMERWPTVRDLARAEPDDVLAAWRGLGYYSRATRIHGAARLVVEDKDMRGLLPADAARLESEIPGVGRYTAGAISAIVFGKAAAMVDGNVLRVLARQLGIYGNIKSTKAVIDVLWAAADALVKAVARDGEGEEEEEEKEDEEEDDDTHVSHRPGRWGQALMELGSTVCAPKPNCAACPITSTCRVFNEGKALAVAGGLLEGDEAIDMEDLCTLCESFPDQDAAGDAVQVKERPKDKKAQNHRISDFFFSPTPTPTEAGQGLPRQTLESIVAHARRFPVRVVKAAVREAETLVCAIRHSETGLYLLHRRPAKGLLAGLWELPSYELGPDDDCGSPRTRKAVALRFAERAVREGKVGVATAMATLAHVAELDTVPWVFSHLKLAMHVHVFVCDGAGAGLSSETPHRRWATADEVEGESMGTGMRRCWGLVKDCGA